MTPPFDPRKAELTRRKLLQSGAGMAAFSAAFRLMENRLGAAPPAPPAVNKNSAPSDLKITDMRACTVAANYDYPIIRIDTNQGVYGLGEVFAAGVRGSALMLKAHLVGKNPLEIHSILRRIRNSAGQYFWNSGYGAIDLALHDIAGKVYGVPVWKLLGPKLRDKVLIYCDTTGHKDPQVYAKRVARRKEMGFKAFKMDLYTSLVKDRPGAVDSRGIATDKGLGYLCEILAAGRDVIGWDTPLAADHFGPLNVDDSIRYARAFEPYQLAWAEDFIAECWLNWRGFKAIKEATTTPILTGEQAFGLEEGFRDLIANYAVDLIHPDYVGSGGILEIKRIADFAAAYGIPTVIHMPGSPIGQAAMTHLAATLTNVVSVEHHAADMPWWQDLVKKPAKPIINDGYMELPNEPGLGVELDDEVVKKHLRTPGYFEPTPIFDEMITSGWRRTGPWPHFDEEGNWCDCVTY
ncbi:MAG: mandelate racemase/muconate lactonizing enzyme family protein [Bryobacteraceae bacterium]|nr:mandelate racemase/muconate lactonizing enzyme family protein [Bryobacteraceae bacterium]